jgi:hypothetical protein
MCLFILSVVHDVVQMYCIFCLNNPILCLLLTGLKCNFFLPANLSNNSEVLTKIINLKNIQK